MWSGQRSLRPPPKDRVALVSGPVVKEVVSRGASVKFGNGIVGQFSLTLWYFLAESSQSPTIAEISFRTDCIRGEIPRRASRRSFDLFRVMQLSLVDWINPNIFQ